MKKLIILLLFIPYMFTSCVDVNPNIKADNHISISIDGDNVDGIQGEWKITSEEKEEDLIIMFYHKGYLYSRSYLVLWIFVEKGQMKDNIFRCRS